MASLVLEQRLASRCQTRAPHAVARKRLGRQPHAPFGTQKPVFPSAAAPSDSTRSRHDGGLEYGFTHTWVTRSGFTMHRSTRSRLGHSELDFCNED
jgi:hypothetical protein